MPFGVYAGQEIAKINATRAPLGRRLLVVAEATNGLRYEPFLFDSKERALAEFKDGPMADLIRSEMMPFGTELMRVDPFEMEDTLEAVKQSEADWIYFDNLEVDSETLDLLSVFTEDLNDIGRMVQIILTTPAPKDEGSFKQIMGYVEGLSIPTEDGVLELGRQIGIVVEQFSNAGLAYAVAGVSSSVNELLTGRVIEHPLEKPVSSDWNHMFASAGLVSFRILQGQTIIASAVNAIQTESPYRQLFVTRALQWFVMDWTSRIEESIGESITQALYRTETETKRIVEEYLTNEIFLEIEYTISYEQLLGEITCEFELLPVFGLEYVQATAVARTAR